MTCFFTTLCWGHTRVSKLIYNLQGCKDSALLDPCPLQTKHLQYVITESQNTGVVKANSDKYKVDFTSCFSFRALCSHPSLERLKLCFRHGAGRHMEHKEKSAEATTAVVALACTCL